MPKIDKILTLEITPDQFLESCSYDELCEIEILLNAVIMRKHRDKFGMQPRFDERAELVKNIHYPLQDELKIFWSPFDNDLRIDWPESEGKLIAYAMLNLISMPEDKNILTHLRDSGYDITTLNFYIKKSNPIDRQIERADPNYKDKLELDEEF